MKRFLIFAWMVSAEAKDFGTLGQTFPIQEKSLLEVIQTKLQNLSTLGQLERHQKYLIQEASYKIKRPASVKGLHRTVTPRSFGYDPTITVPYDLKDHQGKVFHVQGTHLNPLDTHTLHQPLLFIDGEDSEQVEWARRNLKRAVSKLLPKVIFVKGSPLDRTEHLQQPVYFDQGGFLIQKLGITQVPAKVIQKGKILWIEEVSITQEIQKEKG